MEKTLSYIAPDSLCWERLFDMNSAQIVQNRICARGCFLPKATSGFFLL